MQVSEEIKNVILILLCHFFVFGSRVLTILLKSSLLFNIQKRTIQNSNGTVSGKPQSHTHTKMTSAEADELNSMKQSGEAKTVL